MNVIKYTPISFLILAIIFSHASYAECDWANLLPELDGSQCQDTEALSRPFLKKEEKNRNEIIDSSLGSALVKHIALKMADISDKDFALKAFGVEMGHEGEQECSLDKFKEKLPCDSSLVDQNLKKYSKGTYNDIDSFLDTISSEYTRAVGGQIAISETQCMSDAIKREYNLNLFLNENKTIDLKALLAKTTQGQALDSNEALVLKELEELLWKDFSKDLIEMNLSSLGDPEGSSFEEQIKAIIQDKSLREKMVQESSETCREMFDTMEKFLCTEIKEYHVTDPSFNSMALNYNSTLVEDGLDLMDLDFEGVGLNEIYPQYILNCPSSSYDPESEDNIDFLLAKLGEPISDIMAKQEQLKKRVEEQSLVEPEQEKSMCNLLACENVKEVDAGGTCQKRSAPRTQEEMDTLLNCPEDDMCRTDRYLALTRVLQHRGSSMASEGSHNGLSKFAGQFISSSYKKKYETIATGSVSLDTANHNAPVAGQGQVTARVGGLGDSIPSTLDRHFNASPSKSATKDNSQNRNVADARIIASKGRPNDFIAENTAYSQGAYDEVSIPKKTIAPQGANIFANSNLGTTLKSKKEIDEEQQRQARINAMEVQRKTMEDMLATMKDTANIQKDMAKNNSLQRTTLPEIAQSNRVESKEVASLGDDKIAQMERENAEFLARINREKARQNALMNNSALLGDRDKKTGDNYKPYDAPAVTVGATVSGAASGAATSASALSPGASASAAGASDKGTDSRPARLASVNALLDQFDQVSSEAKVETTVNEISSLSPDGLEESGIALNSPFVIVVKDSSGHYTVPVRPSLYRGQRILTPVLNRNTSRLSQYLRKSPLFASYYRFQDNL